MDSKIKQEILALRESAQIAFVGSVNEEGFPQIKAMLTCKHDSIKTHFFSTNLSSKRAGQFRNCPKACVYYVDEAEYKGALFTGHIEICTDHETKAFIWQDGDEIYYPKGIDDEDYCVYRFTAETVNYYHGLHNETFSIEELCGE